MYTEEGEWHGGRGNWEVRAEHSYPRGRDPSRSGLTLLHSWSQLVITPRALVRAALPLLLSTHCPLYSSLSFCVFGHIGEIQASCPSLHVQGLLYNKVILSRDSMKCCWWAGESKGIWLQCLLGALWLQISDSLEGETGRSYKWVFSLY